MAGRAPGGAKLFLHSKASPSRPGEQAPADSDDRAVPCRRDNHRLPTAAGRPPPSSSAVSKRPADGGPSARGWCGLRSSQSPACWASACAQTPVSPRPCPTGKMQGHEQSAKALGPRNQCPAWGRGHTRLTASPGLLGDTCSLLLASQDTAFQRAALPGSSPEGHEPPVWKRGEQGGDVEEDRGSPSTAPSLAGPAPCSRQAEEAGSPHQLAPQGTEASVKGSQVPGRHVVTRVPGPAAWAGLTP